MKREFNESCRTGGKSLVTPGFRFQNHLIYHLFLSTGLGFRASPGCVSRYSEISFISAGVSPFPTRLISEHPVRRDAR